MSLSPGTTIGRYEILSKLGAGGMGEVYVALDTRLKRKVAIKVLPANLIHNQERLRRFEQEAQSASSLNQPNIITIHEIGVENGTHFIATELIEGETLRQRLLRARIQIEETLKIAIQIVVALDAAHRSGIIHRDMKPENVMVREDGLVKVLDFGLAKLAQMKSDVLDDSQAPTEAFAQTAPGIVMGTVAYMSPEQARGKEIDARTDIFSFGIVLYEMLTGALPFPGQSTSDVIAAILKSEPSPASDFNPDISPELERIVGKALAKDREERYQTAKDLLVDLRRLKKQIEIQAEPGRSTLTGKTKAGSTVRNSVASTGIKIRQHPVGLMMIVSLSLIAAIGGYLFFSGRPSDVGSIQSIAVLPFDNAGGSVDTEYLSDGMTETLINSLSELPELSVKARSSVFRYKGKNVEPLQVARELTVQAILNGRVIQHGEELVLYLSLVDGQTGNQLWGAQYNRKLTNILALQSEIANDVSRKLRARLSGTYKQELFKNYTDNPEAYQLYLKGRYHVLKLKPDEIQRGVDYFQQAISIDPSFAPAYVGIASVYRSLALSVDAPPNESFSKAMGAAQKAVELDDTFSEAHAVLGSIVFWHEWNWSEAENQYRRALDLNPNSTEAHSMLAHLLSNTERHAEALVEIKRALDLDPLSVIGDTIAGLIRLQATQTDEAIVQLQKALELDPNFWLARMFIASAYIDKGMFPEAITEARRATELSAASTNPIAFLGYALARSGKETEARAELEKLLRLSAQRYIPPYHIAMIYNGLGERDEALNWLERGFEQRDPKMVFLKVERKWSNLHSEPRFQDLLHRIGFRQAES